MSHDTHNKIHIICPRTTESRTPFLRSEIASSMKRPLVSVIGFVFLRQHESPADAIDRATNFAKEVEHLGYQRYWIPEHHAAPALASACPAILVSRIAGATQSIRVGRRWDNAFEPLSHGRRRTVRHARMDVSRAYRSWSRTGRRHKQGFRRSYKKSTQARP